MYASFIAVALHIIISLGLMRVIGFRAFPLATTIASFVNFALLLHWLPAKIGKFELSPLVDYFTRLVLAAIVAGFIGILLNRLLANMLGIGFLAQVVSLGLAGIIASVVCYITCLLLGVTEARDYVRRLFRK
jgi:peptidoglycan biosynthesis protein MviN/MurJ (putative lipid II flippase)